MAVVRWLDERILAGVSFRLRLVKMALRPIDRMPAQVVMALESQEHDASVLLDPVRLMERIGPVS